MKFIIITKDKKFYLKIYHKNASILTQDPNLAMRFDTRSEANRIGSIANIGEFEVEACK